MLDYKVGTISCWSWLELEWAILLLDARSCCHNFWKQTTTKPKLKLEFSN